MIFQKYLPVILAGMLLGLPRTEAQAPSSGRTVPLDAFFAKRDVTIAVTDSGLGGLSILAGMASRLKPSRIFRSVDLVFVNALFSNESGYNSLKTRGEKIAVFNSVLERMARLYSPDLLVVGCNTLSVLVRDTPFFMTAAIPVLGIVEPGVDLIAEGLKKDSGSVVLIFGTETTIGEGEHARKLQDLGISTDQIVIEACPELANYIEKDPAGDNTGLLIESYMDEALAKRPRADSKVLVSLNCTHYGYSLDLWRQAFESRGVRADILNPNDRLAEAVIAPRLQNRVAATTVRARVISMVDIEKSKIESLGAWLKTVSPETAAALAGYELKPDLFEWRTFIQK